MALSAGVAVLAALAPVLSAQNGGTLSGRVVNSVTGAGIPGASFRLCPYPNGTIHCGNTDYHARADISGAFRITGLPDGQYTVLDGQANGFLWINTLPTITVSGDSQFDVRLVPNANLRGRVFNPDGKPAVGARVKLELRAEVVTNQNGEFVMESVAPGCTCILSATPAAQPAATKDGPRIVTTYYPSGLTADQAGRIIITGVDSSYDIHLQTAPARGVKGVVLGVDGKPVSHVRVAISQNDGEPISFIRGSPPGLAKQITAVQPVETGDDGTFAFPPVIEGDWTLSAMIAHGRETTMGTTRVSVSTRDAGADDISNVRIQLAQPFDLDVTADWGDSAPPETRNPALISAIPLDAGMDPLMGRVFTAEPGQPERFHLFPGRYFIGEGRNIVGQAPTGFYAAAALLDGRDVLNQVIELSGPASIKMIYKSGGGSVHGSVEKGPGATVVLLADAMPAATIGYMGRSDGSGIFTISDLPPGEYTAVALTGGIFIDPRTPEFITGRTREGKRVKVEAGAQAQIELRIALTQ